MRCNIKLKKVTGQSIALRSGAFAEEDSCDCGGMSTPGHGQGEGPDGDKWSLDHAGYVGRGRSEAKRNGVLRNHYYPPGVI